MVILQLDHFLVFLIPRFFFILALNNNSIECNDINDKYYYFDVKLFAILLVIVVYQLVSLLSLILDINVNLIPCPHFTFHQYPPSLCWVEDEIFISVTPHTRTICVQILPVNFFTMHNHNCRVFSCAS